MVVVAPGVFSSMAWPIVMELLFFAILTLIWFFRRDSKGEELPEQHNPAEIKNALIFAGLYAVIVFISAWASEELGTAGLLGVALLSGLTNMDAITLSTRTEEHTSELQYLMRTSYAVFC